jgi:hypothetical protein
MKTMRTIILIGIICFGGMLFIDLEAADAARDQVVVGCTKGTAVCPPKANQCESNGYCDVNGVDLCTYYYNPKCTEYDAGGLRRTEEWDCDPVSGCDPGACTTVSDCYANAKNKCLSYDCVDGTCRRGSRKLCDDGNPLTANLCRADTGACSNPVIGVPPDLNPAGSSGIFDLTVPSYVKEMVITRAHNTIGRSYGEQLKIAMEHHPADDPDLLSWLDFDWDDPYWRQQAINTVVGIGIDMVVDKVADATASNLGRGEAKFKISYTFWFKEKKPSR